jgi:hypothetical protein
VKTRLAGAFGALTILIVGIATEALAKKDRTTLISRQSAAAGGQGGDNDSYDAAINAGGRYALFETDADNFGGPIDTNVTNMYVYDRKLKKVRLVSRQSKSAGGAGTDATANDGSISDDGRYVAFATEADNLGGPADTSFENVYVYDIERKRVRLVSRRSKSAGGAGADNDSSDPSISGNGRFVAFESEASNLSAATNTPSGNDNVYVYDLKRKRIQLVSRQSRAAGGAGGDQESDTSGNGGGAISKSGRFVVFSSQADNLGGPAEDVENVYVYDRKLKKLRLVSRRSKSAGGAGGDSDSSGGVISRNGRFAAFATDSDNLGGPIDALYSNVYVYDLKRKRIRLVSRQSTSAGGAGGDGGSFDPSISTRGDFISFDSEADNLGGPIQNVVNVYVYDVDRRRVRLVSRQSKPAGNAGGDGDSQDGAISGSGRFVVFESESDNLGGPLNTTPNSDNVYIRDRG